MQNAERRDAMHRVSTVKKQVEIGRLERPASTSRTWRATNCAISRFCGAKVQKICIAANILNYILQDFELIGCISNCRTIMGFPPARE